MTSPKAVDAKTQLPLTRVNSSIVRTIVQNDTTELGNLLKNGKLRLNTSSGDNRPLGILAMLNNSSFELHADQSALDKLSVQERNQYEMLFAYTNSKSHGTNKAYDSQIAEWNKTHPDCKIRSQYDKI